MLIFWGAAFAIARRAVTIILQGCSCANARHERSRLARLAADADPWGVLASPGPADFPRRLGDTRMLSMSDSCLVTCMAVFTLSLSGSRAYRATGAC